MKKLAALLILFLSVMMVKAGGESVNYVTVDGKTYFCEKMRPGLFNMNLTMDDGTIKKVPFEKVDSYSCNGRLFERLPVVCKGAPENCTYKKAHLELEYFVFKDGKFYLPVNKENATSILPFFGIAVK